jgi:hypothetical protein
LAAIFLGRRLSCAKVKWRHWPVISDQWAVGGRGDAEKLELGKLKPEGQEGFEVVGVADTALEAVQRVAEPSPDLVLVDIRMPAMDGSIPRAGRVTRFFIRVAPGILVVGYQFHPIMEAHSGRAFRL